MYLIYLLPYELNDDILIQLNLFDLAIFFKRFWVAGQLFRGDKLSYTETEKILIDIVRYMDLEKKIIHSF